VTTSPLALARLMPRPLAFVFGGGGAHGAVQLGMLQALAATDLVPDLVLGTSVGSLNGAIVAADPGAAAATLTEIWPQIDRKQVFPGSVVSHLVAARGGRPFLFDPGPLSDLLTSYLPVATIEELALPFVAMATDLDSGVLVELDSGDLRSALLASSAVPAAFPWVERDGRRLVDGGLVANVPVRQAVEHGAASVLVLDCGQLAPVGRWSEGLLGVVVQALAVATRQQVIADLRVACDVPVIYLPAPSDIASTIFDFRRTVPLAKTALLESESMLNLLNRFDGPLEPGLYGQPPVPIDNPAIAALRRF
jgi:NTE family protein